MRDDFIVYSFFVRLELQVVDSKASKMHLKFLWRDIDSRLLRCSTTKGSSTGSCLVGLAKVKARKFVLSLNILQCYPFTH